MSFLSQNLAGIKDLESIRANRSDGTFLDIRTVEFDITNLKKLRTIQIIFFYLIPFFSNLMGYARLNQAIKNPVNTNEVWNYKKIYYVMTGLLCLIGFGPILAILKLTGFILQCFFIGLECIIDMAFIGLVTLTNKFLPSPSLHIGIQIIHRIICLPIFIGLSLLEVSTHKLRVFTREAKTTVIHN